MRHITKHGSGGYHLQIAHTHPPSNAQQATSRWTGFNHKPDVQTALLSEQYSLCCYSELRADEEGLGYHIEHIENKSQNPARTFDYGNLAASALNSAVDLAVFKAQKNEVFGGHAAGKRHSVDMKRFVSCHQIDCPRYFAYLSDGRVIPARQLTEPDLDRAQYTIDILNLDSGYLRTQRRKWWDELDELLREHELKGWSMQDLICIETLPLRGELQRFFSLTRQFFGPSAENVLALHAPQLL